MKLQAQQTTRVAKEDASNTRTVGNTQVATLHTQLEEDRMQKTVAREILQTSQEMFPIETAYSNDQLWEILRGLVQSLCVNATP